MNVRGERECRDCGGRWSYYGTGSIECPDCGSVRSVGVGGRSTHTDVPATLDLSRHRDRVAEATGALPSEGVDELKGELRAYLRKRGFIAGGELRSLDGTVLAARELLEAVDVYDRLRDPADSDREYLLALFAGVDDGRRPPTAAVPESMREARGGATVRVVTAYRNDLLTFLDELAAISDVDRDDTPAVSVTGENATARIGPARELLERLRDRLKRLEALEGDVDPAVADGLVEAANAIGDYVRTGDADALARARSRLERPAE